MEATYGISLKRASSAILLSLGLAIGWLYFAEIHVPNLAERMELHTEIIHGTASSPVQYRVLVPFIAEGIARLLTPATGYGVGVMAAYLVIDMVAFCVFLLLTFQFLQRWYSQERALIGTLFIAALMPFSLRAHFYHPWSSVENVLVVLALILMVRKSRGWLALVVVIAALNRETSVFIPLTYALTEIPWRSLFERGRFPWRHVGWSALYAGLWLAVTAALWTLRQTTLQTQLLAFGWDFNRKPENMAAAVINMGLFLGAFWVYAVKGFRRAPEFVRRAAGMIPMYLVASALFNLWYETRPLIPTYPVLIALGLAYVYPGARRASPEIAAAGQAAPLGPDAAGR